MTIGKSIKYTEKTIHINEDGEPIEKVNNFKYLGIVIYSKLKFHFN